MTQMALAREGTISPAMERVAEREELDAGAIRDEVARGRMVIPANVHHARLDPMAIGLRASRLNTADARLPEPIPAN